MPPFPTLAFQRACNTAWVETPLGERLFHACWVDWCAMQVRSLAQLGNPQNGSVLVSFWREFHSDFVVFLPVVKMTDSRAQKHICLPLSRTKSCTWKVCHRMQGPWTNLLGQETGDIQEKFCLPSPCEHERSDSHFGWVADTEFCGIFSFPPFPGLLGHAGTWLTHDCCFLFTHCFHTIWSDSSSMQNGGKWRRCQCHSGSQPSPCYY